MPDITIYTKAYCPYCADAKDLLRQKKVAFNEIPVTNSELQTTMTKLAGGRTSVPQIWIGARHIGGCDDLYALDAKGELDPLLASS
jgi:glutaredoxin 3